MRSPSTLSFRRSTPCVAGCWGPKLSSISSSRWRRLSERPSSKDWAKGWLMTKPISAYGPHLPGPPLPEGEEGERQKRRLYPSPSGRGAGVRASPGGASRRFASRRLLLRRFGRLPSRAGAGHRARRFLVVLGIDRRAGVDAFDGKIL